MVQYPLALQLMTPDSMGWLNVLSATMDIWLQYVKICVCRLSAGYE
jgi:hypothetical protein